MKLSQVVMRADELVRQRHFVESIAVHRALDASGFPRHTQQFGVTRNLIDDIGVRNPKQNLFQIVLAARRQRELQLVLPL
ncbi:MAG TPA: hypothetical protein VF438_00590 [Candidatus Paceibacterota bacterium]